MLGKYQKSQTPSYVARVWLIFEFEITVYVLGIGHSSQKYSVRVSFQSPWIQYLGGIRFCEIILLNI